MLVDGWSSSYNCHQQWPGSDNSFPPSLVGRNVFYFPPTLSHPPGTPGSYKVGQCYVCSVCLPRVDLDSLSKLFCEDRNVCLNQLQSVLPSVFKNTYWWGRWFWTQQRTIWSISKEKKSRLNQSCSIEIYCIVWFFGHIYSEKGNGCLRSSNSH